MDDITGTISDRVQRVQVKDTVQNMTARLSANVVEAGTATRGALSAALGKAYSYMPTIETSLLWVFVCFLVVLPPVLFVVYMVSKLESNCNVAWLLSWPKMHPCIFDLGPGGYNWQFGMEGHEPSSLNRTQLEFVAYSHCGRWGMRRDEC